MFLNYKIGFSQIGLGTSNPHPSALLDLSSSDKGLLLPRVANTAAIASPINGLIIYDNSSNCFKAYQAEKWTDCIFFGIEMDTILLQRIGTDADNGNNALTSSLTAAQLNALLDVSGALAVNETAYKAYIATNANLFSSPATASEVLAMITAVTIIATINCSSVTNGVLIQTTAASGVSSVVSYTGGLGGAYSSQTITSTGVTGLTANLASGNFAMGSGTLTYTITGTPSGTGTASFAINIGGKTCTLQRTVDPSITIPATITLAQGKMYWVQSVYDQDYLPYSTPLTTATATVSAADGSNESTVLNIQGTITTTGATVYIPVVATASGTLPACSRTITIPASLTSDGISRDIKLSWALTNYTTATKYITATIAAVGGTLNVIKLDLNTGVGNDALGVLLGQFNYPYNNLGNTTTFDVRSIAGIPDRMFGVADNTGNAVTHLMLYAPILAEDGNIWLNNNLGADYSNINKASFNPVQQATVSDDFKSYGSLFEWGRKSDGHELINWSSSTAGTAVNGTTTVSSNNSTPTHALYIYNVNLADWIATPDDTLWSTEASVNNPCPRGYRVVNATEFNNYVTIMGITNGGGAYASNLKLTKTGFNTLTGPQWMGQYGYYWTSTITGTTSNSYDRRFYGGSTSTNPISRNSAFAIRCIKN